MRHIPQKTKSILIAVRYAVYLQGKRARCQLKEIHIDSQIAGDGDYFGYPFKHSARDQFIVVGSGHRLDSMGQQLQTFFFGDATIDPNTLLTQTLQDIIQDETEVKIIALPRGDVGVDHPCSRVEESCRFYCHQNAAVYSLSPCGHRVLCYTCYTKFIEQPVLSCPICSASINGIN